MLALPPELLTKVSALNWLGLDEIKKQYADLIPDCQNCQRADLLRSIVAFRIQERYYKITHSEAVVRILNKAAEGERLTASPADNIKTAKKIIRNYQGKDYTVLLMSDNTVEYDGKRYRSLTAAAKAITGTHWNGPQFFGLKKAGKPGIDPYAALSAASVQPEPEIDIEES